MEKIVYILRGVPGCGKSTLAESLIINGGVICEADHFFYDNDGNYNFDRNKLHQAHNQCQFKFKRSIEEGISPIVVSNTNTKTKDFKFYEELAEESGYIVFSLVIENRHGGVNKHNVPEETLDRMENTIKNNIKLR